MPQVCVEPAVDFDGSVRVVSDNDVLVFPHVDSCMSVTFMVSPGTLIGGHAGMMNHEAPWNMQAATNLRAILQRMLGQTHGKTVVRAIFIGNAANTADPDENWDIPGQMAFLRARTGNGTLPCPLINSGAIGGGVDVFFDNGRLRLTVQRYQSDRTRGFTEAPPLRANPLLDVPYHAIRDRTLP